MGTQGSSPTGAARALGSSRSLITLALLVLVWPAVGVAAQEADAAAGEVVGVVVDAETGAPLLGAFVSLAGEDWGSVTDAQGRFRLTEVFPGRIELTVAQLGYEDLEQEAVAGPGMAPLVLPMKPKPILLKGLRVVTDRFRWRRNAAAVSVWTLDREDLVGSTDDNALDFLAARRGLIRARCGGGSLGTECLFIRGRVRAPVVYVDETPVLGGLDYLASYQPHELYMVEIYGAGTQIRVYTTQYMARAARQRLLPLALVF